MTNAEKYAQLKKQREELVEKKEKLARERESKNQ